MLKALPAVQLAGGTSHLLCKLGGVPVKSSIFSELRIFCRLLLLRPVTKPSRQYTNVLESKWGNKRWFLFISLFLALLVEGRASLPFPPSLLCGICLLMEQSKLPRAAPLLWSSACNGNSHQGMKCHRGYLMIKDSMPVRECNQGLWLSPRAFFCLCSLPCQRLIDLWKGSEVVLSGKDTLYLLVASPRRDRKKKSIPCPDSSVWLFLPFNSQLAQILSAQRSKGKKILLLTRPCQVKRQVVNNPASVAEIGYGKAGKKEGRWLCGLAATDLWESLHPKANKCASDQRWASRMRSQNPTMPPPGTPKVSRLVCLLTQLLCGIYTQTQKCCLTAVDPFPQQGPKSCWGFLAARVVMGLVSDLPAQLLTSLPFAFSEAVCEGGESWGTIDNRTEFLSKAALVSEFGMRSEFFPSSWLISEYLGKKPIKSFPGPFSPVQILNFWAVRLRLISFIHTVLIYLEPEVY